MIKMRKQSNKSIGKIHKDYLNDIFYQTFQISNQVIINTNGGYQDISFQFFKSQEKYLQLFLSKINSQDANIASITKEWCYDDFLLNEPNTQKVMELISEKQLPIFNKLKTYVFKNIFKIKKYRTIEIFGFEKIDIDIDFVSLSHNYFEFLLSFQKQNIHFKSLPNKLVCGHTKNPTLFMFNMIDITFSIINHYSKYHGKIFVNSMPSLLSQYNDKHLASMVNGAFGNIISPYNKIKYNFELVES